MNAPDIFKITPPRDNIQFFSTDIDSPTLKKDITNHYFNHGIIAMFPGTNIIPSKMKKSILHDSEYYYFSDFPIYEFINYNFIEAFVKKGELTAISDKTMLDMENCCCVTPNGHLVLSVQRSFFLELGIHKGPSVNITEIDKKYFIDINLKSECFNPQKINFRKVYERFKIIDLKMDFILLWEPEDINICPSSVASYFHTKGIKCHECKPDMTEQINYHMQLPKLDTPHDELFEWIGIQAHGGPIEDAEYKQEYLSTYQIPEESIEMGEVFILQLTGLLSSKRILNFLCYMRQLIAKRPMIPWAALHIQGFDDSPVSWNLQPHKFTTRGDNNYTIVFNESGNTKVCKLFTSLKKMF